MFAVALISRCLVSKKEKRGRQDNAQRAHGETAGSGKPGFWLWSLVKHRPLQAAHWPIAGPHPSPAASPDGRTTLRSRAPEPQKSRCARPRAGAQEGGAVEHGHEGHSAAGVAVRGGGELGSGGRRPVMGPDSKSRLCFFPTDAAACASWRLGSANDSAHGPLCGAARCVRRGV